MLRSIEVVISWSRVHDFNGTQHNSSTFWGFPDMWSPCRSV